MQNYETDSNNHYFYNCLPLKRKAREYFPAKAGLPRAADPACVIPGGIRWQSELDSGILYI